jgi:SAM-dependent methyltransferase
VSIHYEGHGVTLHHGDCLDVLRSLPDNSVDSVVTDPPYSLTNRREQYCASDVLRDAIVVDAQHSDAQRAQSLIALRVTVSPGLAVQVWGVDLDGDVAPRQEEVDDDGAAGRQVDDVLVNEGDAMTREQRSGGEFRLWVRQGGARCVGACRCLGKDGEGRIRVPVRLRHDAPGKAKRAPGVVASGGAELTAVLALDVAGRSGELLPASGADSLDPPFELLCSVGVGAGPRARRLATVSEPGRVGPVGDPADGALSFDLLAHRTVLSWRPTVLRGFMSSLWDGTGIETDLRLWRECLRVLKPGGHLLAFGAPRTWHNTQTAIEQAGFEIRDGIAWLTGSGFPKSLDVSKAIDKAAGAEREVIGPNPHSSPGRAPGVMGMSGDNRRPLMEARMAEAGIDKTPITAPATDAAREWQGWGTALKPAFEPVVVARKPLIGTVAANVTAHGTGALNIDACRIGAGGNLQRPERRGKGETGGWADYSQEPGQYGTPDGQGRWPANVILDEDMAGVLDQQSGTLTSGKMKPTHTTAGVDGRASAYGKDAAGGFTTMETYGDRGGASRFFYVAKAPKRERPVVDGVAHPTVKPLALMRWLVRLVTPPGGTVLEPFAGSGTTVEACLLEGFRCVAIEKGDEYLPLILERIRRQTEPLPEAAELSRTTDPARAIAEQVAGQLDIFGEATA